MRTLAALFLVLLGGCEEEAPRPPYAPLISKEPVPTRSAEFSGCSGPPITPLLTIRSADAMLDGFLVKGDSELESILNAKQELNALLGGDPIRDIVVQVATDVPESRVNRLLGRARSAGFVNVAWLAPTTERTQPPRRSPDRKHR